MRRRLHPPRSLRSRLVLGLLVLAAVGLVLFGAVTYASQRSFLLERAGQQAQQGTGAIEGAVIRETLGLPPGRDGDRDGRDGPPPFAQSLPPGTYGQVRDASGRVRGQVAYTADAGTTPVPDLPDTLRAGRALTVGAVEGSQTFRVAVARTRDGTGLVVSAVPLTEADDALGRLLVVEGIVATIVLIVLGAAAYLVVRTGLRPLDRMGQTAGAIAGGGLSRRVTPAEVDTEVGRLGLALNAMLDRLEVAFAEREASEARLRTFLADASHELRTPLASIRAYAELFRMGAASDPADAAKALSRIESESARMGVLVEDLLVLARLDRVRELEPEPVDVGELARDAVDDARATAPGRTIEVRVAEPAVALADVDGIRQVLANLVRNALIHTPEGVAIEVSAGPRAGGLRLEVRDHGPGLPPDDPGAVFERFWRAGGGRTRGAGGAGLGLSIVAGIVAGHGGEVAAANAPDGGAVFTIDLPAPPDGVGGSGCAPGTRPVAGARGE